MTTTMIIEDKHVYCCDYDYNNQRLARSIVTTIMIVKDRPRHVLYCCDYDYGNNEPQHVHGKVLR